MSCDTSPQTTSSPPIKFHTAAFTCSSPSCRKRKRESEGDEVRPYILRSHQKFLAQNEGMCKYISETISLKLKDDRGLSSDPSPPITCSPQSMKRTREPEDKEYFDNFQSSKRYLSQMAVPDFSGSNVKDFPIGDLMESPSSLKSMCNKSDDDLGAEMSRNFVSDSPHHPTGPDETISCLNSPPRSHANQSNPKPDILQVPRSPSDRCQNKNLRRTALLRSVKLHDYHSHVLSFGRDEESKDYVVRTSQDNNNNNNNNNNTAAAAARSRFSIETLDGFLSQKCHL